MLEEVKRVEVGEILEEKKKLSDVDLYFAEVGVDIEIDSHRL